MTVQDAITQLQKRTHQTDVVKVIEELNSARRWAFNKIFNSEGGPNSLVTFAEEFTLAAFAREIVMTDELEGTPAGFKRIWLKLPTEQNFTIVLRRDANDPCFAINDQWPVSDESHVATGHPVFFDVINYSSIRVSPGLPADSQLRVDYFRTPPDLSPSANNDIDLGEDTPEAAMEAVIARATALLFDFMDDTRAGTWYTMSEQLLRDAISVLGRRTQGPVRTQPFTRRRRVLV